MYIMDFPIELKGGKILSYEKDENKAGILKLEYQFSEECIEENGELPRSCDVEPYYEFKTWFDENLSEFKSLLEEGDVIQNVLLHDYRMTQFYFFDGETVIPPYNIVDDYFQDAPYEYGYLPKKFAGLTNKPIEYWTDITNLRAMNLAEYKDQILENMKVMELEEDEDEDEDKKKKPSRCGYCDEKMEDCKCGFYIPSDSDTDEEDEVDIFSWFVADGKTYGITTSDNHSVHKFTKKISKVRYYTIDELEPSEIEEFLDVDVSINHVLELI